VARRWGTPLYLWDPPQARRCWRRVLDQLGAAWPRTLLAYCYKTNPLAPLRAALAQLGAGAEVSSGPELDLALGAGVPPERLVFDGPFKSDAELRRAAALGVLVHVESEQEARRLDAAAAGLGLQAPVGLRVAVSSVTSGAWDRFGVPLQRGEARDVALRIGRMANLQLRSLHSHLGTQASGPAGYGQAAEALGRLRAELSSRGAPLVDTLDLGGGYPGFDGATGALTPLQPFAEALHAGLSRHAPDLPRLVLEPGRCVATDTLLLVARVVAVRVYGGEQIVTLDAGRNLVPTAAGLPHPVHSLGRDRIPSLTTTLYGPLCTQWDWVARDLRLPRLFVGELVCLQGVGSYDWAQSHSFIRPRAGVLALGPGGECWARPPEVFE